MTRHGEQRVSQARRDDGWVVRALRAFVRGVASAYFRLGIQGLDRIPKKGGAIIAGNHPSVLDGILLWAVSDRPVRFLIAEDMYNHRFLNPFFRAFGCIQVFRTKTRNGDALRAAVSALERGELIGIFPEGTIHFGGTMQQMRKGVALLALKTGVPIVPLAIRGSGEAFPDGAKVPRPWAIQLRFESPVSYAKTSVDPIPEEHVAQTLEEIRLRVLQAMRSSKSSSTEWAVPRWVKEAQVLVAALVVWPLSGFLTLTANPSLDPIKKSRLA